MKTAITSACLFTAALAFSGAALAHSNHSGSSAVPAAETDAKNPKKDSKSGKKGDCKHDKDHPCKGDPKSGQAK